MQGWKLNKTVCPGLAGIIGHCEYRSSVHGVSRSYIGHPFNFWQALRPIRGRFLLSGNDEGSCFFAPRTCLALVSRKLYKSPHIFNRINNSKVTGAPWHFRREKPSGLKRRKRTTIAVANVSGEVSWLMAKKKQEKEKGISYLHSRIRRGGHAHSENHHDATTRARNDAIAGTSDRDRIKMQRRETREAATTTNARFFHGRGRIRRIRAFVIRGTTWRRKYFYYSARVPHASWLISREPAIVLTNLQHCASLSFFTRDGTVKGPHPLHDPRGNRHLARALLWKLNAPGAPNDLASQDCRPVSQGMSLNQPSSALSTCDWIIGSRFETASIQECD